MKTSTSVRFISVLLLLFSFIGCEKDREDLNPAEAVPSADLKIKSLVEAAGSRYLGGEVSIEDNFESVDSGRDGLVDEYTADNTGFSDVRSRNILHSCLRLVQPDRDQRLVMSRAFTSYAERNKRIISAHREQTQNLQQRIAAARIQLLASLENGEINRDQYRQRMQVLREKYQDAVQHIRTSNVEAFSRSYTQLLEHLSKILSKEQWDSFTECMSS